VGVRLLEKNDLLEVLKTAPALGTLLAARPQSVMLSRPKETWQTDDAAALLEANTGLAGTLVAEESACASVASAAVIPSACLDVAVDRIARCLFRRPPTADVNSFGHPGYTQGPLSL
jgi:hypothetical protein